MQNQPDKSLIKDRFFKSMNLYSENALVQKKMADQLILNLEKTGLDIFSDVLELGCGTGILTAKLLEKIKIKNITGNDIVKEFDSFFNEIASKFNNVNYSFVDGDIEKLNITGKRFDLIVSNAVFQWITNFDKFINNISGIMKKHSILAFSSFDLGNFEEIKGLMGVSLNYISSEKLKNILEKNFEILYFNKEKIKLRFDSAFDVLRHIKNTGVNGVKKDRFTSGRLNDFARRYSKEFKYKGGVSLTYTPIYFILRKK